MLLTVWSWSGVGVPVSRECPSVYGTVRGATFADAAEEVDGLDLLVGQAAWPPP